MEAPSGQGPQAASAPRPGPLAPQAAQTAGFNVVYGDGSRPAVLQAAGIRAPRAVAVCYEASDVGGWAEWLYACTVLKF